MTPPLLSVSITTRNRPAVLDRCIRSMAVIRDLVDRVIVVDDGSDPALDRAALISAADAAAVRLELIRFDRRRGIPAARNHAARVADTRYIFELDDDAYLLEAGPIRSAVDLLAHDPHVAAVAFPQVDAAGRAFAPAAQPAPVAFPCYVPSFIGFACVLDRDRLLDVGGFREMFVMQGEERELCLRWLDRGFRVVYLPDQGVAHVADPSNRDLRSYVRLIMRNDCLNALLNEPLARAMAIVPLKLWSFGRMTRGRDIAGLGWIARELVKALPSVLRSRHAVRWSTVREWNRLKRTFPPYLTPADRP